MTYLCHYCQSQHDSRFLADLCEDNDILNETIRHLIYSFGDCETTAEVNEIVTSNLEFLNEHPCYYVHVKNARKRIANLRRAKMESTELIYKN